MRSKLCTACESSNGVEGHHVKHRGAGGDDIEENLLPLCRWCHIKIHTGMNKFVDENEKVFLWLFRNGWSLTDGKWKR